MVFFKINFLFLKNEKKNIVLTTGKKKNIVLFQIWEKNNVEEMALVEKK